MTRRDSVFASSLGVLMPFEGDLPQDMSLIPIRTRVVVYTFVPAGIVTVLTLAPDRPLTLHVKSVEVTSVTGLLLGGTRIKLF